MLLPQLPFTKNSAKKYMLDFAGLNRKSYINDNQLSSATNLSLKEYPILTQRPPRAVSYTLTNGKALFAGPKLCWVDELTFTSAAGDITFGEHTISSAASAFSGISVGDTLVITGCTVNTANNATVVVTTATAAMITCSATTFTITNGTPAGKETAAITFTGCSFKYDNVTKGAVTATAKSMVDFNNRIVIFPDKVAYNYTTDTFAAFGTGTFPTAGAVPDLDYVCTMNNRIFGVKGDNIYCTALGEYDDWTTFAGLATDAWSVDTGTNGSFTGVACYKNNTVLAFKADRVWKLFGNIPSNFQFVEISRLGCVSHKSICEVNNYMFYMSVQGMCVYGGGSPSLIGEELNETYTSGVAGGDGIRYYISLYNGTTYNLYVYDTEVNGGSGMWIQEDNLNVTDFALLDGYLYALALDHKIYKFNSGTERISWEAITKVFTESINEKKGHSELSLRVDLDANSIMQVFIKKDNQDFVLVKSYTTNDLSTFVVPVRVVRADHFQIKLSGVGSFKMYSLVRKFTVGSNL